MFYTVYKITNNTNGKIYIGCHKTNDITDGYMGSGKLIMFAIEKYGLDNFSKEIIGTFETEDQMFAEEKNLISKMDPDYNIHPGGNGGWGYINEHMRDRPRGSGFADEIQQKNAQNILQDLRKNNTVWYETWKHRTSVSMRGNKNSFGKSHTEETKKKIGQADAKHQKGKGNSQFGSMWITDDTTNRKIKKDDVMPEGWHKGRTF